MLKKTYTIQFKSSDTYIPRNNRKWQHFIKTFLLKLILYNENIQICSYQSPESEIRQPCYLVWHDSLHSVQCSCYMFRTKAWAASHEATLVSAARDILDYYTFELVFSASETFCYCWILSDPTTSNPADWGSELYTTQWGQWIRYNLLHQQGNLNLKRSRESCKMFLIVALKNILAIRVPGSYLALWIFCAATVIVFRVWHSLGPCVITDIKELSSILATFRTKGTTRIPALTQQAISLVNKCADLTIFTLHLSNCYIIFLKF